MPCVGDATTADLVVSISLCGLFALLDLVFLGLTIWLYSVRCKLHKRISFLAHNQDISPRDLHKIYGIAYDPKNPYFAVDNYAMDGGQVHKPSSDVSSAEMDERKVDYLASRT